MRNDVIKIAKILGRTAQRATSTGTDYDKNTSKNTTNNNNTFPRVKK